MDITLEPGIFWVDTEMGVEQWVKDLLRRIPSTNEFLSLNVLKALAGGTASLYYLTESGELTGFCVVRGMEDMNGKALDIWVLYSDGREDPMEAHSDFLTDMARSIGANRLRFSSSRLGWLRTAPKYGFKFREIIFEREVDYGWR
jgi:hypothetical protein